MNKVILCGRMTKDPDLKFTPGAGTAIASFGLAVERNYVNKDTGKPDTDFINIMVFGKRAEAISNHMRKGRLLLVQGRLQIRSYEKDGIKRYVTEVVAEEVDFIDWGGNKKEGSKEIDYVTDVTPIDDDDIPF